MTWASPRRSCASATCCSTRPRGVASCSASKCVHDGGTNVVHLGVAYRCQEVDSPARTDAGVGHEYDQVRAAAAVGDNAQLPGLCGLPAGAGSHVDGHRFRSKRVAQSDGVGPTVRAPLRPSWRRLKGQFFRSSSPAGSLLWRAGDRQALLTASSPQTAKPTRGSTTCDWSWLAASRPITSLRPPRGVIGCATGLSGCRRSAQSAPPGHAHHLLQRLVRQRCLTSTDVCRTYAPDDAASELSIAGMHFGKPVSGYAFP